MSEPIATRLESYRTAHGLTQRQMADRLGVSWRTYRGWINRPTGGPAVPLLERLLDEWEPVCVDCAAALDRITKRTGRSYTQTVALALLDMAALTEGTQEAEPYQEPLESWPRTGDAP